jgi:hypothetical protein
MVDASSVGVGGRVGGRVGVVMVVVLIVIAAFGYFGACC